MSDQMKLCRKYSAQKRMTESAIIKPHVENNMIGCRYILGRSGRIERRPQDTCLDVSKEGELPMCSGRRDEQSIVDHTVGGACGKITAKFTF